MAPLRFPGSIHSCGSCGCGCLFLLLIAAVVFYILRVPILTAMGSYLCLMNRLSKPTLPLC